MSVAAALLLMQTAALAVLAPQGRWQVEYHPEMCVLSRNFGTGDTAVTVGFQTATSESTFMLVIMHPKSGSSTSRRGKLTLSTDGVELADDIPFISRMSPTTRTRIDTAHLSRDLLPSIEKAARLSIRTGKSSSLDLAPTGTAKGITALVACEQDLMASWGFDMAARAKVAVKPKGNPGKFFGSDIYPTNARSKGESGRVVAILDIDIRGHIESCRIAVSSKSASLDTQTCQIAKRRIVYSPAGDAADRPIAAQQYLAVNWHLDD